MTCPALPDRFPFVQTARKSGTTGGTGTSWRVISPNIQVLNSAMGSAPIAPGNYMVNFSMMKNLYPEIVSC